MQVLRQVFGVILVVALAAANAAAQCAMCYESASAQDGRAMQALNAGIIMLLIPPVAIMGAILFVAARSSKSKV